MASGVPLVELFVSEQARRAGELLKDADGRGIRTTVASERVMASLSDAVTPQGVIAVARAPQTSLAAHAASATLVVVLAEVRDPGNAGTLIRSAAAAGAGAVVFTRAAVDPLNPKSVRAAAGALFKVPVVREENLEDATRTLRAAGFCIVGARAGARTSMYDFDFRARVALILGNESWGLSELGISLLDYEVAIPMPGPTESLNVGIAGSVLCFEIARQRAMDPPAAGAGGLSSPSNRRTEDGTP